MHAWMMDADPVTVTIDHFLPLVGETFTAVAADGGHAYTLISADLAPAQNVPLVQRPPFVLVFHSDTPEPVQGTRMIDVPGLGITGIFMVPFARMDDRIAYESIYN